MTLAVTEDVCCHLGATPEACIHYHIDAREPAGLDGDWHMRSCPACGERSLWIRPGTIHRIDWFCEMQCDPIDIRYGLLGLGVDDSCLGGYRRTELAAAVAEHAAIVLDAARYEALLRLPRDINANLHRICVQALAECDDLPADPLDLLRVPAKEFYGLAERAGIDSKYRYQVYAKFVGPAVPRAIDLEAQELYRHFDVAGRLLYLGISGDRESRQESHRRYSRWWELVDHSTTEPFQGRAAVAAAEIAAIKAEHPLFNEKHNNTPEARERLRVYLEEIERMDLLRPAA